MTSYIRQIFTLSAHQKATVGDTKFSVIPNDHLGWLLCDGRTVNVADFRFLFNVIGYSYGGSGTTFDLPDPAGRIPAVTGTGTDSNLSTLTVSLGTNIGEYVHQLSILEMPSHNHGVAGGGQISSNNSTSMVSTNITLTDPQHRHTGTTDAAGYTPSFTGVGTLGGQTNVADDGGSHTHTFTTNLNSTGMILVDPTHSHSINPAGGDKAHNNVQPMTGMGNMFIYCGRVNYGSFPYTRGTNIY
jgi:microcystin-dependent protein